jgi:hypothetical protein
VVPFADVLATEAPAVLDTLAEPPELLEELPAALDGLPDTVGDALAAMPVLALLPASLEPPQPARATLRVTNARPWPSHPRFFWFLSFFALFMLLAPLFR